MIFIEMHMHPTRLTLSDAMLQQLAHEHRRVLSGWRGLLMLRRASFSTPPDERRWSKVPEEFDDLAPVIRQMRGRGEIRPIKGYRHLWEVTAPFAQQGFIDEREVLFELHPYAVLSHLSALLFHGLTEQLPKRLTAMVSIDTRGEQPPIGTTPPDWEGIAPPGGRTPTRVLGQPVEWIRTKPERFFGIAEYQPLGYPVRYTTPERTLIDAIQSPETCGGIANVLRAWALARDRIDLDVLVHQVERFDVAVLRQRVGYLLDRLDLSHPRTEYWRTTARRGGSSRLVGASPFASTYDQRWSLSLNAPIDVLAEEA